MIDDEYWFWLCNISGIRQRQIEKLMHYFESPKEIFEISDERLYEVDILKKEEICNIVKSKYNVDKMIAKLDKFEKDGIHFIHIDHKEYPYRFKNIPDKPFSFYYKGNLPDDEKYSVGMVGARSCSGYGKECALKISKILAASDINIISGMATGIDSYSSKGALLVCGKTYVVLGTGIDIIYPQENIELYYQILLNGGGVISEYPPGTKGVPWQFPHRNRLISALCDKLLIIEAKKRSGTLTTASHALSQGIDVYAVPGRIDDVTSEGCNRLIADGCGIFTDVKSFLEDLYGKPPRYFKKSCRNEYSRSQNKNQKSLNNITEDDIQKDKLIQKRSEKIIYKMIGYEPTSTGELIEKSGMDAREVSETMMSLLLFGLIEEISQDVYVRS